MEVAYKLTSSLEKIFFERPDNVPEQTHGTMLKNEIYSFQLAIWCKNQEDQSIPCKIKIKSPLEDCIRVYTEGYVPVMMPSIYIDDDDDYINKMPHITTDPLFPVKDDEIVLMDGQTRAFWFEVEPKSAHAGTFPIEIEVWTVGEPTTWNPDKKPELVLKDTYTVEILDAELPELPICNAAWFHGDCIAKLHNVEIGSPEYNEITEKFLDIYTKFGHNGILTPIVTPPLNTKIGKERPTNQLVDVTVSGGEYSFGFDKLKNWIILCHKYGIRYFEMAHLFTQWGAKCAPKIMATVDGEYKRIFGWETDAGSEEYQQFLDAFLPALVAFLKKEGVYDDCYFHTSDEPAAHHMESYSVAKKAMLRHLPEEKFIDALAEYSYYEKGLIYHPVVCSDHIHKFWEKGAKHLWTYYCMSQRKDVSNRFMAQPSYRNRIIGCQLYKSQVEGFLHWGYNFWFTSNSQKVINPYIDTTAGNSYQSGDSFMVYPLDEDGEVVCSHRLYVFNEGLQDMRALTLLEKLTSREEVEALLTEVEGFGVYPRNNAYLLKLRERVNRLIAEKLN